MPEPTFEPILKPDFENIVVQPNLHLQNSYKAFEWEDMYFPSDH